MNQKFKQTEIGKIPEDWDVVKLSDIGNIVTGTTPSTRVKEYWGGDYPFVTPTDFSESKYVHKTERYVTQEGVKKARLIPKESVMVTCIASIGEVSLALKECITNQQINTILCNEKINPHYIYYAMLFRKKILKRWAGITTSPIIKKSLFEKFPISLPSISEQKAIAEILSTADEAIRKSNEIIAKTGLLKKGLMQELLTKGIGHEEFKDTEIGRILKEWEVVKLGDVCEQRNEIVLPSGKGEFRFVGLEHINSGETKIREYKPDTNVKSSKFRFYLGDILYGKLRPYLDKTALSDFEGICSTDLLVLKSNKNKILAEFLTYLIHSNRFIQYAIATTSGTNHPRTSWSHINKFKFGLPSLPEQQKITLILSTVERKLELERSRKQKLERIKKGLMNDLLTGNKRVGVSR